MSVGGIYCFIRDGLGTKLIAHVHDMGLPNKHNALLVMQERFLQFKPEVHPFLDIAGVNGADMGIDARFTGVAAFIYEDGNSSNADSGTSDTSNVENQMTDTGQNFATTVSVGMVIRNTTNPSPVEFAHVTNVTDTVLTLDADAFQSQPENFTIGAEWPGTAIAGTWNFSTDITNSSAGNNDEAQFDNPHTSVMSNYVAVTGGITLTAWDDTRNSLLLSFELAGVAVGNSINLNDFIDTSLLGVSQNFVIPKDDLGLSIQTVDEMTLFVVRNGGAAPNFDIDNIQFEKAGGSVIYAATTPPGTIFHVEEVILRFRDDDFTNATANGNLPGWDTNVLMGAGTLTNGMLFSSIQGGVSTSIVFKNMDDFEAAGAIRINEADNATGSAFTYVIKFPAEIILDGNSADALAFSLSDDFSSINRMTAAARGKIVLRRTDD